MKTINHECYVSIEVAKLLKEAGFDWGCCMCYSVDSPTIIDNSHCMCDWNCYENSYSAPTLAVAQKWLREVKGQIVEVLWFIKEFDYRGHVIEDEYYKWTSSYPVTFQIKGKDVYDVLRSSDGKHYNAYEEALETGIKKYLELLLKD